MGIDVYLKWDKMDDEDHKAQLGKGPNFTKNPWTNQDFSGGVLEQ